MEGGEAEQISKVRGKQTISELKLLMKPRR